MSREQVTKEYVKIEKGEKPLPIKKRYDSIEEAMEDLGVSMKDILASIRGEYNNGRFSFRILTHIDMREEAKSKKRREKVLMQNSINHERP